RTTYPRALVLSLLPAPPPAPTSPLSLHDALPISHRRLLEAVVTDALDVLLRNDPGGAGGRRRIERHEVGPGLLQPEPDALRVDRSEEHTSELQSPDHLVCRLLLEKKKQLKKRSVT